MGGVLISSSIQLSFNFGVSILSKKVVSIFVNFKFQIKQKSFYLNFQLLFSRIVLTNLISEPISVQPAPETVVRKSPQPELVLAGSEQFCRKFRRLSAAATTMPKPVSFRQQHVPPADKLRRSNVRLQQQLIRQQQLLAAADVTLHAATTTAAAAAATTATIEQTLQPPPKLRHGRLFKEQQQLERADEQLNAATATTTTAAA